MFETLLYVVVCVACFLTLQSIFKTYFFPPNEKSEPAESKQPKRPGGGRYRDDKVDDESSTRITAPGAPNVIQDDLLGARMGWTYVAIDTQAAEAHSRESRSTLSTDMHANNDSCAQNGYAHHSGHSSLGTSSPDSAAQVLDSGACAVTDTGSYTTSDYGTSAASYDPGQ